ncbi:hypothetical protein [Actinomadura yumaensis]|uniref:Uncharacterized protein n=2 Tax=Thermomonosporaceae TaxID=2012 RepID=A0ABW2CLI0_9ACTN
MVARSGPTTERPEGMRNALWWGMRAIAVGAGGAVAGVAACGLAVTSVASGVFGLAYLLQGTWSEGLMLMGVYMVTGSPFLGLAWFAKRRTARARARAAAAVGSKVCTVANRTVAASGRLYRADAARRKPSRAAARTAHGRGRR